MPRYFGEIIGTKAILSENDIHHLTHVLRFKVDQEFEVVFNGDIFRSKIVSIHPFCTEVIEKIEADSEFNQKVTLFFCLAKKDKIEFVVQKASELGATNLVLVSSARSVVKLTQTDFERKKQRYMSIAKEASEQCKRTSILSIDGLFELKKIPLDFLCDKNFIAYEENSGSTLHFFNALKEIHFGESVSIFVGPEGGFEKEEIRFLEKNGFQAVSLGKRILRCETAAVYGLSVIGLFLDRL